MIILVTSTPLVALLHIASNVWMYPHTRASRAPSLHFSVLLLTDIGTYNGSGPGPGPWAKGILFVRTHRLAGVGAGLRLKDLRSYTFRGFKISR